MVSQFSIDHEFLRTNQDLEKYEINWKFNMILV